MKRRIMNVFTATGIVTVYLMFVVLVLTLLTKVGLDLSFNLSLYYVLLMFVEGILLFFGTGWPIMGIILGSIFLYLMLGIEEDIMKRREERNKNKQLSKETYSKVVETVYNREDNKNTDKLDEINEYLKRLDKKLAEFKNARREISVEEVEEVVPKNITEEDIFVKKPKKERKLTDLETEEIVELNK